MVNPRKFNAVAAAVLSIALVVPAFAERPEFVDGAYFVGFKGSVRESHKSMLRGNGASVQGEIAEANAVEIRIKNSVALQAIANNPNVEYVEQVPMRYKMALSASQMTPSLSNGLYGILTTNSNVAHGRLVTGSGIKIGVADTQLAVSHPDIALNLKGHTNCVGANPCSGSGYANDGETHATHVAGTITGVNNTSGVIGVAYNASLYHARVLGPNGGSSADIMRGVSWLQGQGCKIINLSLGGGLKSRTEENFYKDIRTKGVLVVAATGNDSKTSISFPAGYAVNFSVGAVDVNNAHASFSNTGRGIDISAPGVMILSSVPAGTGHEASVTAGAEHRAFGMEFSGSTAGAGTAGTLVDCGIGNPGECLRNGATSFVALIQRGTLDFATKVTNATAQGATAAIIYNNAAGDFSGTLGAAGNWIPAVAVSQAAGVTLKGKVGTSATVVNQVSDWDHYDGTSMATPHVAGVAGLVWSVNSALTPAQVEDILIKNADDLGAAGYDTTFGYGLANAARATCAAGKCQ